MATRKGRGRRPGYRMSAISSERWLMSASSRGTTGGSRSAKVLARSRTMAARIVPSPPVPPGPDLRRLLPSVEQVLQRPEVRALEARHGRPLVVSGVRGLVEEARAQAAEGDSSAVEAVRDALPARLAERLERAQSPSLVRVINATGVVIHTNLGRAPLPASAAAQVARVAA